MDDEYEDEEDQWEDGAQDILEKGEEFACFQMCQICVISILVAFWYKLYFQKSFVLF